MVSTVYTQRVKEWGRVLCPLIYLFQQTVLSAVCLEGLKKPWSIASSVNFQQIYSREKRYSGASKTKLVVVTVKSTASCTCVQNSDNTHDIRRQKLRRKRVQQCMHTCIYIIKYTVSNLDYWTSHLKLSFKTQTF